MYDSIFYVQDVLSLIKQNAGKKKQQWDHQAQYEKSEIRMPDKHIVVRNRDDLFI